MDISEKDGGLHHIIIASAYVSMAFKDLSEKEFFEKVTEYASRFRVLEHPERYPADKI